MKQKFVQNYIIIGCFLSYLLFGFVDNIKGPAIPVILADMNFDYSLGGAITFMEYTGFFLASFFAGYLADLFGRKFPLLRARCCLLFGIVGYSLSSSLPFFFFFIFFIGLGCGSLELAGGNIIASVRTADRGRYLNLLNAFFGIGAVFTPIMTGWLFNQDVSWRSVYLLSLAVVIPIGIYFLFMKLPREQTTRKKEKVSVHDMLEMVMHPQVRLLYLAIFAYVAAEIGVATWMVDFLQKSRHISVVESSMYLSVHFAGIAVGRLFGSLFVDRLGHLQSLLLFSVLSAAFIAIGSFGPASVSIVLAFTGFGYSIIFPTATAVISEIPSPHPGTKLGLFYGAGGLGGAVGPWIAGLLNDLLGLKAGMAVNLCFCLVLFVCIAAYLKSQSLRSFAESSR